MVAKKRRTMRSRVASKLSSASVLPEKQTVKQLQQLGSLMGDDPNAFLHQSKETKKEKQLNKQNAFISQIKKNSGDNSVDPQYAGISKSSIRRRKRKLRETLKPRLEDLLTSMEQEKDLKKFVQASGDYATTEAIGKTTTITADATLKQQGNDTISPIYTTKKIQKQQPGSVIIKKNEPSIRNKRGRKVILSQERSRFDQVVNNQLFLQNTFGTLRDIIKMQKN